MFPVDVVSCLSTAVQGLESLEELFINFEPYKGGAGRDTVMACAPLMMSKECARCVKVYLKIPRDNRDTYMSAACSELSEMRQMWDEICRERNYKGDCELYTSVM